MTRTGVTVCGAVAGIAVSALDFSIGISQLPPAARGVESAKVELNSTASRQV
jgi:hypothetical protein